MHKKLEADLISLAHQILQMKDKDDVIKLKEKAALLHEKLAVLVFVDNYFLTTPNASEDKTELKTTVENATNITEEKDIVKETVEKKEKIIENKPQKIEDKEPLPKVSDELEKQTVDTLKAEADEIVNKIVEQETSYLKNDVKEVAPNSLANNEEFKDSIPADVAADLFEKAEKLIQPQKKEEPVEKPTPIEKTNIAVKVEPKQEPKPTTTEQVKQENKTSLNDRLYNNKLQIGLNDRIAFVKHLFNFSQEEFNRVLSQLNTFESENAAKDFIQNQVKPDYNWSGKEEYVERLLVLIERKFM